MKHKQQNFNMITLNDPVVEMHEMSREETDIFCNLCMAEMQGIHNEEALAEALKEPALKIMDLRWQAIDMSYRQIATPAVMLFVASLCEAPYQSVLWAWTLLRMQRENKVTGRGLLGGVTDIKTFALEFPHGIPGRDGYVRCWDSQKHEGCNLLDRLSTWQELVKEPSA